MTNKIIQMMMELNTDNVFTLISESYKNGIITSLKDFDKINNNRYICKVKKGNGNYYKIIIFENEGKLDIDILESNKDYELIF